MDDQPACEPPQGELPNSAAQRARLADIAHSGAVGGLAHCVTAALEIHGAVPMEALQAGVDHVVRRRPALRCVFHSNRTVHTISDDAAPAIQRVATAGKTPAERLTSAYSLARAEAFRPFPVGQTPLLDAMLFDAGDRQLLLLKMDQLTCDAWSANLIVEDLVAVADQAVAGLPIQMPSPDEYPKVRYTREKWVRGPAGQAAVARRRAALVGHTRRWPLAWAQDSHQGDQLVESVLELDADATAPFLRQVRTAGGSVFSATALAFAMATLGPADRVALSSTFACRQTSHEEGVAGWFSNEVVIPLPPPVGTVSEMLRALRARLVAALNDQAAPHQLVAGEPHRRDGSGGPTVSLLYLPWQLTGSDQASMPVGAATADRRRVTICPTGADVDLFVAEGRATDSGHGRLALSLGAMSSRGGLAREALEEMLSGWRDAILRLGGLDWRIEQCQPAAQATGVNRGAR